MQTVEIIIGVIVSLLLLYIFYEYLGWCSKNAFYIDQENAGELFEPDEKSINYTENKINFDNYQKYKSYMLGSEYSDSYKIIRYFIHYNFLN